MSINHKTSVFLGTLGFALGACGGEDPGPVDEGTGTAKIELVGTWKSNFDTVEVISESKWGRASIVEFDGSARIAYTQNATDDAFSPSAFNRLVWTTITNNSFYYCTVDFGLNSLDEAKASTKVADAADPDNAGCGGFAWTKLTAYTPPPPFALAGTWTSNFGGMEVITSTSWNGSALIEYDNDALVAYTQNPADAQWGPNEFNKQVWAGLTDNSVYYCTVDYGFASLELAKTSTKTFDASEPEASGCGGFSWTKLSK